MSTRKITIRTLLFRDIGGLFVIALAATLAVTLYFASQGALLVARDGAEDAVETIRSRLETHFEPAIRSARVLGVEAIRASYPLTDAHVATIATGLKMAPQVKGLGLFWESGEGMILSADGVVTKGTFGQDSDVREALENARATAEPFIADPVFSEEAESAILTAQHPVFDDNGRFLGLAAGAVSIVDLSLFVRELRVVGGAVFVIDDAERVIAHPALANPSYQSRASADKPLLGVSEIGDPVLSALIDPESRESELLEGTDGIEYWEAEVGNSVYIALVQRVPVSPGTEYAVGVYLDSDTSSYVEMFEYLGAGAVAGLIVMALALLRLRVIAERIRSPISELAEASNAVAKLDLERTPHLKENAVHEFGEAANAFNAMVTGLSQFGTYVPRSLVRQLMQADGIHAVASAERQITVLFSDIVGFTTISQNLPAERVAALLNTHFTLMNDAIEAEGGNIDKYVGDSVMAFWGAPLPSDDHAERCLRAVRRIVADIEADNRRRVVQGHAPIRVRIGIATGPAIVGNIGAPGRINYTTVGDTVNVANRLEQLGKTVAPDLEVAVLVSETTVNAASRKDDLADAGFHELRGRTGAVRVYRLDAEASALSRGPEPARHQSI